MLVTARLGAEGCQGRALCQGRACVLCCIIADLRICDGPLWSFLLHPQGWSLPSGLGRKSSCTTCASLTRCHVAAELCPSLSLTLTLSLSLSHSLRGTPRHCRDSAVTQGICAKSKPTSAESVMFEPCTLTFIAHRNRRDHSTRSRSARRGQWTPARSLVSTALPPATVPVPATVPPATVPATVPPATVPVPATVPPATMPPVCCIPSTVVCQLTVPPLSPHCPPTVPPLCRHCVASLLHPECQLTVPFRSTLISRHHNPLPTIELPNNIFLTSTLFGY